MTELTFAVIGARAEPHAAIPTIMLRLRIEETSDTLVHALALRCQIRIEPNHRKYDDDERARLYELFGETPQWGDSLRPFLWTHVSSTFAGFRTFTEVDLPIECSYDFEVSAAKYLHSLASGEIPLLLLFTGTVFTRGHEGFSAEPVSWAGEASYRLPVALWREVIDCYFPNGGWLRLDRQTIDRLQTYKAERALPTFDMALEQLLIEAGAVT